MKKILFSLMALVASMSMNAQVMKVMKNGVEVATYKGADYTVVFEEASVVNVTSITLDKTTAEVEKGGTVTLAATVNPEDASNKEIQWASSDDTKATVSAEGVVTGVAEGTVTITATAKDGSGVSATCTIIVLPPVPEIDPLTLTALEDGSEVSIDFRNFQYKTSTMADWVDYVKATPIQLNNNEYVQFRGKPGSTHTDTNYSYFVMSSGSFKASGNIMSLLNGREMRNSAFFNLFKNCASLKDASELLLPTTLTECCYGGMFEGCTSLVNAPALPATTLAEECYQNMFYGCKSLVNAPALPATTLERYCYTSMFYGCESLVTAPALPATELAEWCYYSMFEGCASLVNAPALPATTLERYCYYFMFHGCISLVNAPALPATTLERYCYNSMFDGCTSLKSINVNFTEWDTENYATGYWVLDVPAGGTFTCPAGLPIIKDKDHIPEGWTVVNQ